MSEYERFTEKNERGFYKYKCSEDDKKDCLLMENCGECYGSKVLDRLGELEDKIEQGTLIELPCKVGDTIYVPWVYDDKSCVSFHEITRIEIYKNSIDLCFYVDTDIYYVWVYIYSQGRFSISELGNRFFLTREEAEKRLKELKE